MAETDKLFAGSIPKFYDTLMVPLIFADYAADLAALVASFSPGAVLETAAGSGVVTRLLAPQLGASACHGLMPNPSPESVNGSVDKQGGNGPDPHAYWAGTECLKSMQTVL